MLRPLAYSYTRFSSLAQAGGDSVRRQTAAAREWCERHDAELVEDFADLGVSAFRGKNAHEGALAAFMKLAEGGRVPSGSFLLVESLDRITRDEITRAVSLILRIIDAGVHVVTLADGAVYDSASVNAEPTKLIVSITILMRAHEESLTKSKRVRAAWERKHELARTEVVTTRGPNWLKRSGDSWRIIETKARIVRRVFDEICEGKALCAVVRGLNDEGVPTLRKGKSWSVQTVRRLLDGRAVLGEYQPHATKDGKREPVGAPIAEYYPQIIEPAQWAKAQLMRPAHKRQRGGGKAPMNNAFRGLIFTPDGEPLHAQKCRGRSGRTYSYLRANSTKISSKKSKSWNYDEFKALFALLFEKAQERRVERSHDTRAAERLRLEIEAVRAKEGNLARVLANGYVEAIEQELRRLGDERAALEERLLGAEAEPQVGGGEFIAIDDDERLGENVRSLVKRIVVDANERRFSVETLTGELFEYCEEGGEARFFFPESVVPFPDEKSRSA
jgi:DNA invertase Pin-like site-specific DNA recombinase